MSSHTTSEQDEPSPVGGYAATLGLYGVLLIGVAVLTALTGRSLPRQMSTRDLMLTAVASHKISRTVTKDAVTRALRAPVTTPSGDGGPGEVMEKPKHAHGLRRSLGELVTCPFCFDVWAVTGLAVGHIFLPRFTKFVVDAFVALAGADFLHLAYATAQQVAEG